MASVNSPIRKFLKPILKTIFGDQAYLWFQLYGKIRDIKYRLVEEDEMRLLPRLIKADDTVIDIGANFAYYTTRMSQLCPKGRVLAFEPIPSTYWVCNKIVSYFRIKNVRLFELGVGERTEVLTFEVPLQKAGSPSAGQAHIHGRDNKLEGNAQYYPFENKQSIDCKVVALDDPEWQHECKNISFIKMDIEGAELFALKGMRRLLERQLPVILLEVCPYFLKGFGLTENSLVEMAASLGYKFYVFDTAANKLVPHEGAFSDRNYFMLPEKRLASLSHLFTTDGLDGHAGI